MAFAAPPMNYRWAFIEHTLLVVFVAALFAWHHGQLELAHPAFYGPRRKSLRESLSGRVPE